MAKDRNYKSDKGNDYIIKGGVYTGYGAYDKEGNRITTEGSYDHPVDVMYAINKIESKEGESKPTQQ